VGLTAAKTDQIRYVLGWSLSDIRDRLLLALGYETLCRRSELVALAMEHVERYPSEEGSILVSRSKADPFGAGRRAYLSKETLSLLDCWIEASGIGDGAILRSFRKGRPDSTLHPASVSRILKQLSRRAGFPDTFVTGVSGHSLRVGAAQDMAAAGVSLVNIMQAGGWKSAEMVLRYIENIDVRRSGMAQLLQQKASR
jgi:integrase